jgi:hypothetical protein
VTSAIGGLALSPDGEFLYALDLSEALLYRLDPGTLEIKAKLVVAPSSTAMSLSPDGKKIYVVGSDASPTRAESQPVGRIQIFSTDPFKGAGSVTTQVSLFDVVATDRELLVTSAGFRERCITMIDLKSQSEHMLAGSGAGRAHLRLSLDQKRVYYGDIEMSPGNFHSIQLWRQKGSYPLLRREGTVASNLGGSFEVSPDGRFLIGAQGAVLRLSKNKEADLQFMTKIDRCKSIVMAAGCDSFFTFNSEGFAKSYSLEDFVLTKSVKLGFHCGLAVLDVKRRRIHGVFSPVMPETGIRRELRAGRISSIELSVP